MGKLITSPVDKFPGTVILYNPVPYPAYIEWEKTWEAIDPEQPNSAELQYKLWGGVRAMVEEWHIEGYDIQNPHIAPNRGAVLNLLSWLVTEIGKVIIGDTDPNA